MLERHNGELTASRECDCEPYRVEHGEKGHALRDDRALEYCEQRLQISTGAESGIGELMACARCGGFLVSEEWTGFVDIFRERQLRSKGCVRCVNCGSIDDLVILANRLIDRNAATAVAARLPESCS